MDKMPEAAVITASNGNPALLVPAHIRTVRHICRSDKQFQEEKQ